MVGPVGSGKSTACVLEILLRAMRQAPGPDGVRRTRFAVIRNTYPELRDTTRKTFEEWIPQDSGVWNEQRFSFTFKAKHPDGTRVDCEVLFRALDRPEDVKKLLSLELTGAYINEVREVPQHVFDVLQTRVGRYPSKKEGGASWFGIWADSNPWHAGHWAAKLFSRLGKAEGHEMFRQPGGRAPGAENVENLPGGYYDRLCLGKSSEWIKVYVDGQDASGDEGSIFGPWLSALDERGGLLDFSHPVDGIYTSWDLGKSDSTAIWFWRIRNWKMRQSDGTFIARRDIDIIDHYENARQSYGHYFDVVDGRGYEYACHFLPHDAKESRLETDQTMVEKCVARWGADLVEMTPNIGVDDGIDAARWLLEQPYTRIHSRCGNPGKLEYSGLDALRSYRYGWDEKAQCFSRTPIHNFASHSADAFRYVSVVAKQAELVTRPDEVEEKPVAAPADGSFILGDLIDDAIRERRRNRY